MPNERLLTLERETVNFTNEDRINSNHSLMPARQIFRKQIKNPKSRDFGFFVGEHLASSPLHNE
jgi:hypothetical protein